MMQGMQPPSRMRYSLESRCRAVRMVIEKGVSVEVAASACGAHRSTVDRWVRRFRADGWVGLVDRPSTPQSSPRRLSAEVEAQIVAVRRATQAGPVVIGAITGRPASTVGKVLRRWGCSRLPKAERDPVRRYGERPGELIHVDTKKLGRFHVVGKRILKDGIQRSRAAGWQHLHVAIDDHTRLAYTEVLAGQDRESCAAFLRRAVAWYSAQGIRVERVLSDNAKAYHSHHWRDTCHQLGIGRRYTRPYTPRTNGKAEALIKTMLREWAYRHAYPSSHHRTRALAGWTRWYNRRRPHGSLQGQPPISRVAHLRGQYS